MIVKPRLIGLCGDIGSGKSTVAEYLMQSHGYRRKSFAAALKHTVLDVFGPLGMQSRHVFGTQEDKDEQLPGIVNANGAQTGRRILQHIGTEGFRFVDPDVWVKHLLGSLEMDGGRSVVEDVRFPNEVVAIHDYRGTVIEVRKVGGPEHAAHGHASDTAWKTSRRDYTVLSEHGDLATLFAQVDAIVKGTT